METKKMKSTSEQYRELAIKLRKECEDYLKEVLGEFKVIPLRECQCEMDCDGANAYVVYDGGNHPEYASNGCSDVIDVHLYKDGSVCVNIEDCEDYDIDRVAYTEDLEPLTDAVAAAVWCIADSVCSLVCPSWDDKECRMAKEDFEKLQDVVLNDGLIAYFEDEDAEDYEDYCNTFNPKACVRLLVKWAKVEGDMVTFNNRTEEQISDISEPTDKVKVYAVAEHVAQNWGDEVDCILGVYSTREKAEKAAIKRFNEFVGKYKESDWEEFIPDCWYASHNIGWSYCHIDINIEETEVK